MCFSWRRTRSSELSDLSSPFLVPLLSLNLSFSWYLSLSVKDWIAELLRGLSFSRPPGSWIGNVGRSWSIYLSPHLWISSGRWYWNYWAFFWRGKINFFFCLWSLELFRSILHSPFQYTSQRERGEWWPIPRYCPCRKFTFFYRWQPHVRWCKFVHEELFAYKCMNWYHCFPIHELRFSSSLPWSIIFRCSSFYSSLVFACFEILFPLLCTFIVGEFKPRPCCWWSFILCFVDDCLVSWYLVFMFLFLLFIIFIFYLSLDIFIHILLQITENMRFYLHFFLSSIKNIVHLCVIRMKISFSCHFPKKKWISWCTDDFRKRAWIRIRATRNYAIPKESEEIQYFKKEKKIEEAIEEMKFFLYTYIWTS